MIKIGDVIKFEKLAEMMAKRKELDEKIKEIQTSLIAEYPTEKNVETELGKLTLTTRKNYGKPDNGTVIAEIGMDNFLIHASISITPLKEFGGQALIDRLIYKKALAEGNPSVYYTLRAKQ